MNASWRMTACGAAALALLSLSPHPGPAQEPQVFPPPRAARPEEAVELEVPPGMPLVLEVGQGSKSVQNAGESRVEGDATITLGNDILGKAGDPGELLRRWKESKRRDALRLHVYHSRITVAIGQPNYPSHVFIEPLPALVARK